MGNLNVGSVLGPDGRIARRLEHYEHRAEQLEMAEAVERAITNRSHLLVEAGTGVGKSFAYLIPSILAVLDNKSEGKQENRKRLVISTHTISLQEQLIQRDIPFLNAVLPVEFSAVLVKGRSNYISLRRLKGAQERSVALFSEPAEIRQLDEIARWAGRTTDGSRSDLEFRPQPAVWSEVQSEHGNCLGRRCPTYQKCFYYQARRRVWNADLLVVNHALFFSDLALRREGANLLPDYDVVVLDEAHTLEAVAGDHLGLSVSSGQIEFLLNKLYNDRSRRGLLLHHDLRHGQQMVHELRFQQRDLFDDVREWQERHGSSNGRLREPPEVNNPVSPTLAKLGQSIRDYAKDLKREEEAIELTAQADRCQAIAGMLKSWLTQSEPHCVYWVEATDRARQNVKLVCAPIDLGPILREELFNQIPTAVLTSATLAVGRQDFHFIQDRLGLTSAEVMRLGSPFDYKTQMRLVLPEGMPDPSANPAAFETEVVERLKYYIAQTEGRAFVLFTSYRMLQNCANRLASWFQRNKFTLYAQGEGLSRSLMLDRFRKDPRGVLFGADSFWQGVDVPGEALQNVIITKLPFSVPDQPLLEARLEAIRAGGQSVFRIPGARGDHQIEAGLRAADPQPAGPRAGRASRSPRADQTLWAIVPGQPARVHDHHRLRRPAGSTTPIMAEPPPGNSKSESRNPKKIPLTEIRISKNLGVERSVWDIRISSLFRVSDFVLRISIGTRAERCEMIPDHHVVEICPRVAVSCSHRILN